MPGWKVSFSASPAENWDSFILSGQTGSLQLFHLKAWAERLTKLFPVTPLYVEACYQDEPVIRVLAFTGEAVPRGMSPRSLAKRCLSALSLKTSFRWYGEPIVKSGVPPDSLAVFARELQSLLKEKRYKLVSAQWPKAAEDVVPSQCRKKTWSTLKVDLTQDPLVLFEGFKNAAKKEIRKAEAAGITVRRVETLDELRVYYDFASRCAKRYKKSMFGFQDYSTMWEFLRGPGIFETFVAYHEGKAVAGLSVWGTRAGIAELGSFQSEEAFQKKLSGGDLIKWEAIRWAHAEGIHSFDLGGVNPQPQTEKENGIRRFKEKWSQHEFPYLILSSP